MAPPPSSSPRRSAWTSPTCSTPPTWRDDQAPWLLAEVLEIAHGKGVPVLVDAASQVFPRPAQGLHGDGRRPGLLRAKYIGGPNSSGILCGKKALVDAAAKQGFIGFDMATNGKAFGRPLKLDRQEIIAVVVALQEWMAMDHERRLANLDRRASRPSGASLEGLPGVNLEYLQRVGASPRPARVDRFRDREASAAEVIAGPARGQSRHLHGRRAGRTAAQRRRLREGEEEIVAGRPLAAGVRVRPFRWSSRAQRGMTTTGGLAIRGPG